MRHLSNSIPPSYFFYYSRVAVIRGRVMTSSGRGLAGVRISHENQLIEGYTMTQEDGWFDFMVNGGGAATLRFGKNPFPPTSRSFFVPWNEVGPCSGSTFEGLD